MDHFTPLDWFIAGAILVVGLVGSAIKVFLFDEPETKSRNTKSKR